MSAETITIIQSTLTALKTASDLFQSWMGKAKADDLKMQEALSAFLFTLAEAKNELSDRNVSDIPSARRNELGQMWLSAAIKFRGIDDQLADTLMLKGFWWSSPDQWNYGPSEQLKISFDQLEQKARALLNHK